MSEVIVLESISKECEEQTNFNFEQSSKFYFLKARKAQLKITYGNLNYKWVGIIIFCRKLLIKESSERRLILIISTETHTYRKLME